MNAVGCRMALSSPTHGEVEREAEREVERGRERSRGRETHGQTARKRNTQTHREKDRQTDTDITTILVIPDCWLHVTLPSANVCVCVRNCTILQCFCAVSSGYKCAKCDITDNLWLNLTDGSILCGRKFFDGASFPHVLPMPS